MKIKFELEVTVPDDFPVSKETEDVEVVLNKIAQKYFDKNYDYQSSWRIYSPVNVAIEMMTRGARIKRIDELKREGKSPVNHEGVLQEFIDLGVWSILGYMSEDGYGFTSEEICEKFGLDINNVKIENDLQTSESPAPQNQKYKKFRKTRRQKVSIQNDVKKNI